MVSRIETEQFDITTVHQGCLDILETNHWTSFLTNFCGHNEKACPEFATSFDGEKVVMENLIIKLSEYIMAQVIGLP